MGNIFDYLTWRGDLTFTQDPPNAVDALIFSTLTYVGYGETAERPPETAASLRRCAEEFFALENPESRVRSKKDMELLRCAAATARFGQCGLCLYRSVLLPEQETQFAAMTFLLDDGSMFLAYRGTDNSLVGWKEDFNMSYLEAVPAQVRAAEYTAEIMRLCRLRKVRIGGHSKGGNLAAWAGLHLPKRYYGRLLAGLQPQPDGAAGVCAAQGKAAHLYSGVFHRGGAAGALRGVHRHCQHRPLHHAA